MTVRRGDGCATSKRLGCPWREESIDSVPPNARPSGSSCRSSFERRVSDVVGPQGWIRAGVRRCKGANGLDELHPTWMAAEADELPGDLLAAMRAEHDHRVPRHQVHTEQLLGRGAHDDGLAVEAHVEDHDRRFGREGTRAGASTDARVVG